MRALAFARADTLSLETSSFMTDLAGWIIFLWTTCSVLVPICLTEKTGVAVGKTLPFTGAQILSLQISKSERGAKKNGYYHSLP